MANTAIKFYVKNLGASSASTFSTDNTGSIVFDKTAHALFVNGTQYGGNVSDATFLNNLLTITKADGTTVQLDFSTLATAASVMAAFNQIQGELNNFESAIGNCDSSDGEWNGYGNGTNYLGSAQTLTAGDLALDSAIKSVSDRVEAIVGGDVVTDIDIIGDSATVDITDASDGEAHISVDGNYNATTNKIATVDTVTSAIADLDVNTAVQPVAYTDATSSTGASLTFAGMKETDGKIVVGDGTNTLQFAKVATSGAASDVTITDANSHFNTDTVQGAIDELYTTASGALQSVSHGTDTGSYVTLSVGTEDSNHNQELYVSSTVQAMSTADSTHMGLAEASDVKSYVDTKVGTAVQSVDGSTDEKAKSVTQSSYATVKVTVTTDTNNDVKLDSAIGLTIQGVSSADSSHMGLAEASDVKSYVTTSIQDLDTTNDVAVASLSGTTLTLNGSIKEVDGVIDDGSASDVTLEFASAPTNSNKILTQAEIADLSGAMHFKSVITTSTGTGNDYVSLINSYYTTSSEAPKVGDVFVDSTSGKEYVVKSLPASGTTLSNINIEEFGSVDPTTQVTSLTSGTSTTGLDVTSNTSATGAVTVNVNAASGYQIPTTTQMTKVNRIAVTANDSTDGNKVTDGTTTLTHIVSDANYEHITVSATDGVTAGGVTYKYTHPTATDTAAAAVKVGNDAQGHVVLGAALTGSDIAATSGTYGGSSSVTTVQGALDNLTSAISGAAITIDGHKGAITTGNGLTDVATDGGSFEVQIDSSNANGLSVGSSGIALATATTTTAGAMSSTDKTKLDGIAVNTSAKSVTDGTNILSNLVSDANYAHITVTSTSVSAGSTTFNKYEHPTKTATTAGAYKVGNDDNGHVVLGSALESDDIALDSFNTLYDASNCTTVDAALTKLNTAISTKTASVTNSSATIPVNNSTATTLATVDGTTIDAKVSFYWEEYA